MTIKTIADRLQNGAVIISPTDTIPGFTAIPSIETAKTIRQIKGRAEDKPFIFLVASRDQLAKYVSMSLDSLAPYLEESGRPTTVIFDKIDGVYTAHLPKSILAKDGSAGFRICAHPLIKELCSVLDSCLISTSVNVSGELPALSIETIPEVIRKQVDLIVERDFNFVTDKNPSRIISIKNGVHKIIRS
ncbi:Sua5/YciO/YrdC/YwlC family protein [Chitinophagales bacterium]|nr:Sua5/YciO/YrdC/YwlC family protein [Chitinophagales bacterium]